METEGQGLQLHSVGRTPRQPPVRDLGRLSSKTWLVCGGQHLVADSKARSRHSGPQGRVKPLTIIDHPSGKDTFIQADNLDTTPYTEIAGTCSGFAIAWIFKGVHRARGAGHMPEHQATHQDRTTKRTTIAC